MPVERPLSQLEPAVQLDTGVFRQEWYSWLDRLIDGVNSGLGTTYTDEMAQDAAAALIKNGTGISWVYDDGANSLTPTITLAPFNTGQLAEGANLYFTNERVDDRVAALIQNGPGISWSYNDVANTLTPTVSVPSSGPRLVVENFAALQALAAGAAPAADVRQVDILGYHNFGDMGACSWRLGTVEPNHDEKLAWDTKWLEMLPHEDGTVHLCQFGFRPTQEVTGFQDCTPFLVRAYTYIKKCRRITGVHEAFSVGRLQFPPGWCVFKTIGVPSWDFSGESPFAGVVIAGHRSTRLIKDFGSNGNADAIFKFVSGSRFVTIEGFEFGANAGSLGTGSFISMVTSSAGTIGDIIVKDCYFGGANNVGWNIWIDGELGGAAGSPAVRGAFLIDNTYFAATAGSVGIRCGAGVVLDGGGHAAAGGTSAQISIQGTASVPSGAISISNTNASDIAIDRARDFSIGCLSINNLSLSFCSEFIIQAGRVFGAITTTANTTLGQLAFGVVQGAVTLNGSGVQGRGRVLGVLTVGAGNEWDNV